MGIHVRFPGEHELNNSHMLHQCRRRGALSAMSGVRHGNLAGTCKSGGLHPGNAHSTIFEVVLPQGHAADNDEAAVAIQSGGVVVGRRTYGWLGQESNQPRPVHSHMQGSGRLDTWTLHMFLTSPAIVRDWETIGLACMI